MNNKKLFEEAIAEAKSIREAAIANAKEALEESLTPHIKELLAQRLTEMEEEEDKLPDAPEEKLPVLEAEEDEKEDEKEEGAEEAGEEEAGEKSEEDMELEDMSVEELKDLIRDIVGQMVDQDGDGDHDMEDHELEGPEMPEMGMEEPAGEEAPEDEEIDLDELLAELAKEDEEDNMMEKKKSMMETPIEEAVDPSVIDAFIQIIETDPSLLPWQTVAKALGLGAGAVVGTAFGIEKLMSFLKSGKAGSKGEKLADTLSATGAAAGASVKGGQSKGQYEQVASELNEAKKTIKQLTSSLQEVNLLNAKLLFVNKVLKENKHLSDAQVANVIATFDKATTAKEAKLVYESFATTLVRKSNAPVVESKLKGLASKSVGVAPAKVEVITEVSDAVKRMQKLAGIIK